MTVAVLAAPHTSSKHRNALREIDMAPSQAQSKPRPAASSGSGSGRAGRSSARLNKATQEKGEVETNGGRSKRKAVVYDEDIEGFQFTRLPSKKSRPSVDAVPVPEKPDAGTENPPPQQRTPRRGRPPKKKPEVQPEGGAGTEVREKRAEGASKRQTRGSMRGTDAAAETQSESATRPSTRKRDDIESVPKEKKRRKGRPSKSDVQERNGFVSPEPQQSGTAKITLPLADTPVIQRNKEMRKEAKGEKGSKSRRSSLGMRGRRASSLIDSGASNALPHKEVGTADFYKHIADGLPEPRRMRQLLTWCATRALSEKPKGARPEDASARLAARVIQEELLKDFSTNSELSNWFGREDVNPPAVVVKKPNPKNLQNADKIKELEEQIQRLQRERHSLNELLRPPSIAQLKTRPSDTVDDQDQGSAAAQSGAARKPPPAKIDPSLLEPSQQEIYAILNPTTNKEPKLETPEEPSAPSQGNNILPSMTPSVVSARLSRLTSSLGPTLDSFAAGVHDIELYRAMSDAVSSRVLRICAERLEERDARNAMRRLAIEGGDTEGKDAGARREKPREDLGVILGALSRVERR
ncbi:Mis12-Mtw1 family protein [Aspergillus clavatus NRRL 1]|uniref:Mis12-Mtw1 domain protein n=1 Tax=Aspergillus clavatus (strain ATCC 1007 / CBS 513.65 / DSM 816 / NCTC 3887 / NRRL 1 / QM 1276 / 107) TaxID=344612 RepID=A1CL99_ASPCL|nr:Mis12-Mtw1 domain protein [Aspergillus clavatus NRRL 1]EAW09923.1 Mis12-Mtw1 domain protein [Aspergillus clavatus NRRL 1]